MPQLTQSRPHGIPKGARSATARVQLSDVGWEPGLDEKRMAAERMARTSAQEAYFKEYAFIRWPAAVVTAVHDDYGVSVTVYEVPEKEPIRKSAAKDFDPALERLERAWDETGFLPHKLD